MNIGLRSFLVIVDSLQKKVLSATIYIKVIISYVKIIAFSSISNVAIFYFACGTEEKMFG